MSVLEWLHFSSMFAATAAVGYFIAKESMVPAIAFAVWILVPFNYFWAKWVMDGRKL